MYPLIPKNPRPEQLVLSFGLGWRLFFGAIGALIAYGMIQEGTVGVLALIITVILILAALYLDRWEFDRQAEVIKHSSGLLLAHRTKRYALTDLQEVVTRGPAPSRDDSSEPERGLGRMHHRGLNRGFTRLWLRFEEAGEVDIQMDSSRHSQALRNLGMEIAGFCDVAYRDVEPG